MAKHRPATLYVGKQLYLKVFIRRKTLGKAFALFRLNFAARQRRRAAIADNGVRRVAFPLAGSPAWRRFLLPEKEVPP